MRPERLDISKKRKFDNMEGRQYGEITILYPIATPNHVGKENKNQYYWAQCSCGKEWAISSRTIKRNKGGRSGARACAECTYKIGAEKRTLYTPEQGRIYKLWISMKGRCSKDNGALCHGARGIYVCDEWNQEGQEGFNSFYTWALNHGYQDNLTLDRKDVNGPYSPENCHWITKTEQNYNKRNTLYVEINGEKTSLSKYYYSESNRIVPYQTVANRYRQGWTLEEMFSIPYGQRRDGRQTKIKKDPPIPQIKPEPSAISPRRKDWTGAQLGQIDILYPIAVPDHAQRYNPDQFFWARCTCGKEYAISHHTIMKKVFACKSCTMKEVGKRYYKPNRKARKRLNKIWLGINKRCSSEELDYGSRGITVCEEWRPPHSKGFENFYSWAIDNGYSNSLTLERLNVNGNYEPDNCTWITKEEQNFNKRNTIYVEYEGIKKALCQIHKDLKSSLPYSTIYSRYNRGWDIERIFSTPYKNKG